MHFGLNPDRSIRHPPNMVRIKSMDLTKDQDEELRKAVFRCPTSNSPLPSIMEAVNIARFRNTDLLV